MPRVSRLLHAGYVFESGGTEIAFDPIFENPFSRNGHAFPDARFDRERLRGRRFAAVFLSHFHDDHCSLESLDLLDRSTPIHFYCRHEVLFELIRGLGFTDVRPLIIDQPVTVGPFRVVPRRAFDADVDSMFQIEAGGLRVLNVVDSEIDAAEMDVLARLAPWDLVLWPFQTMRERDALSPSRVGPAERSVPPEWIEQLRALSPRFVIPSACQFRFEEWSWLNRFFFPISYRRFGAEVEAASPSTKVVRLNPGVSVVLSREGLAAAAPFEGVHPVGDQDVDYEFDPGIRAPPVAEIARRFPALTEAESAAVSAFCREGLIARSRERGPSADPFFRRRRRWTLSVYDHRGEVERFHFVVDDGELFPAAGPEALPEWTTAIAAARLHGALFEGESLTSLYARINDGPLDPRAEKEIGDADVLDDPLLRALFNGDVASYQRAQARRLGKAGEPG